VTDDTSAARRKRFQRAPCKMQTTLLALFGLTFPVSAAAQPMDQNAVEAAFDAGVSAADQAEWIKAMSSAPNQVGSPHNKANAQYMLALFRSWGWDTHIETFSVLYPTPISTLVEMVASQRIGLGGQEPPVPGDDSSANVAGALPPYLAYQGDGDVTADLVYVNFGMPDDYEALVRRGIDVRGKIVIARYGAGWRGLKPKLAQDHGAVGCIIYSDPAQDGYAAGDVYPNGDLRPPESVQRGSVMDMAIYPGDPLTPGVGATRTAKRLSRADAKTILKIPALPMSYGDASKLLSRLGGAAVPSGWQGALPFTYHVGGNGGVSVHLAIKSDWKLTPIYNVIAKVKGSTYPDEWVLRGNHHDAWVTGADDPLSGNAAMMSEMKAIGGLLRQGWRPKRTLVFASWDGEEASLLGSTEWAEAHAAELKAKGLIYINTDGNERGLLEVGGSSDFQHLVTAVADDVIDPDTGVSILRRRRANVRVGAYENWRIDRGDAGVGVRVAHLEDRRGDATSVGAGEVASELTLNPLGSGSDYSAYLQHLGLAAIDLSFVGKSATGGIYHSLYDDYQHFVMFNDPGLRYGAALAKVTGRIVLRIADADTPPVRFEGFAAAMESYVGDIEKLQEEQRLKDMALQELLADDSFRAGSDPEDPVTPPTPKALTILADLTPLQEAVADLKVSAAAFDSAFTRRGSDLDTRRRLRLNTLLRDIDQLLLDPNGLPGRPWYRHLIYAPGRFTGYGAKTIPGVREAIEERRFDDAKTYVLRTAKVLNAYRARLDEARRVLDNR
jgi:N-acetylated-alpha-linked acidic dipeptidase